LRYTDIIENGKKEIEGNDKESFYFCVISSIRLSRIHGSFLDLLLKSQVLFRGYSNHFSWNKPSFTSKTRSFKNGGIVNKKKV